MVYPEREHFGEVTNTSLNGTAQAGAYKNNTLPLFIVQAKLTESDLLL